MPKKVIFKGRKEEKKIRSWRDAKEKKIEKRQDKCVEENGKSKDGRGDDVSYRDCYASW